MTKPILNLELPPCFSWHSGQGASTKTLNEEFRAVLSFCWKLWKLKKRENTPPFPPVIVIVSFCSFLTCRTRASLSPSFAWPGEGHRNALSLLGWVPPLPTYINYFAIYWPDLDYSCCSSLRAFLGVIRIVFRGMESTDWWKMQLALDSTNINTKKNVPAFWIPEK